MLDLRLWDNVFLLTEDSDLARFETGIELQLGTASTSIRAYSGGVAAGRRRGYGTVLPSLLREPAPRVLRDLRSQPIRRTSK